MRIKLFLSLAIAVFFSLSNLVVAQSSNAGWTTLARVDFELEYDDLLGLSVEKPIFSQTVKDLEGKSINLRGYVIPTEGYKNHKEFVFSAYPYSMCFFCGGAGPETVVEVYAKKPIEYSPDAIEIKGILKLNPDDPNALLYSIEDAEVVTK